jgi:hypothetical protein
VRQTDDVLLPPRIAAGVADGSVTLAFRRWEAPRVKVGGTFVTTAGVLRIDSVEEVADVDDAEVAATGAASRAEVLRRLKGAERPLFRIGLSYVGPDPRVALRASAELSAADLATVDARLARLDRASSHGAWTRQVLELIEARPAVRAPDLAAGLGRETAPFKIDVRELKALGLTHSLPVGYELSPRGRAYLAAVRSP